MACRGVGYSNAEDIILGESFLQITQDPIVGRYQSSERFWERVGETYNERVDDNYEQCTVRSLQSHMNNYEQRTVRLLQSRMNTITVEMKRLNACLRQIEYTKPSGKSNEDIVSFY